MRKWTVLVALGLVAAAAYGVGFGFGGFGGIALPMGDMAAEDDEQSDALEGGDLGMSPKFGGKVLIGVMPALDVEVAFAYHLNHKQNNWEETAGIDEPKTTLIPITFGANYKLMFDSMGVYFGGGGGFYMEKVQDTGEFMGVPFSFEVSANKPGIYVGGGFLYSFGKLALDVSPRFNYVMNSGDYDVDVTVEGQSISVPITKDYKDMYVDVLFGANYYFM
ncbi:MAG: hypothetical protein V3T41_08715 [bacterium]